MTDWSFEPLEELLPSQPTPFTWSILGASCERAIRSYYVKRGYDWPNGVPLLRLEVGEPQLNGAAWATAQVATTMSARGGPLGRLFGREASSDLSADEVEACFDQIDRWAARVHRLAGDWMQADILQVMEEVERQAQTLWALSWRIERATESACVALVKALSGDEAGRTAAGLLAGLEEEGEGQTHLWELGQALSPTAFDDDPIPDAARALLDDFSHRSENDLEAASPRWREAPQTLIPALSALSPPREAAALRTKVEEGVMANLGIVARRAFRRHLQQARVLKRLRGKAGDRRARLTDGTRAWALAAGEVATKDGRLPQPSHIFLFEIEEVKQLMTGEWHNLSQIRALVDARRHEHTAHLIL